MASEIQKHLERARRGLEKNKLREAISEYQAVLNEMPGHQEALQALADIHTRLNEPALAAQYYGAQFDRLIEAGDHTKAAAIFARFLRPFPQPAGRVLQYATLLQKQNRVPEALEQFGVAAELFLHQQRGIDALACYESMAVLDPESASRHVILAELAERLRHADLAARSFLRAAQLTQAGGSLDEALEYFSRAHQLSPNDRSGSLLFADAKLRKGDAEGAVALLEPLAPNDKDTAYLGVFGEALLRTARLDRAWDTYLAYYRQKPNGFEKLFELISAYIRTGDDAKGAAYLEEIKDWMRASRRENEFSAQMDRLASAYPHSLALAETVARSYEQLNREAKYFDALVRLFDLYLAADRIKEACDALDRLVDIDPYDYRNQERISKLEGKVEPAFLNNVFSRVAKAATVSTRTDGFTGAGSEAAATSVRVSEEFKAQQALEDLIVQVEIFLQYSLQSKAVERLERIAELFAGEEERNERLRALYERANWWPKGVPIKPVAARAPTPPAAIIEVAAPPSVAAAPTIAASTPAETHRDLATIAEINRLMYRQPTPREVLGATAAEIGKYLGVTRCLIAVGTAGEAQLTAEYAMPGTAMVGAPRVASIARLTANAKPDPLGGIELSASSCPGLSELGLQSALAVPLTDKEAQGASGVLLAGSAAIRSWKPNESFFLQAIGDQLMLSVSHTRLRSLVRSLAVADEKTGLLSRGAYVDCLLVESNRARSQGTPLSLILLQIDHGGELLRQHGDVVVEQFMEQLARALSSSVRQTDIAVKYTAWSLVFVLPNTSLESARSLAEKLRQVAATVQPSWGAAELTVSAIVAEASTRPGDDTEDRVTEWINRAEAGLDEARQRGGNALVPLATP
jgi:diguanylate cyclase (GGDEF)-like protein